MATILITGATDGIGLALARIYQQQNAQLILIGRRALSTLDSSFFTSDNYCQIDLANENCTAEISAWLHEHGVQEIDLVVHNAAIGYVGEIANQPLQQIREMIQINLWTPIALSHMLFPLVERARGKIAFITSVATALPSPDYATYTATKTALEGFVRSWQIELAADKSPAQLQIIRPGATRTAMHRKSGADLQKMRSDRFPSAETVAAQIAVTLTQTTRTATIGTGNRLIYHGARLAGRLLDLAVLRSRRAGQSIAQEARGKPHCVITGAADGIGRALAEAFAHAGYVVTGIDVDMDRAGAVTETLTTAGYEIKFIAGDLAALDRLPAIVAALRDRPPIDLLIHNAGISAVGAFHTSNLARQRAVLDINFTAPLLLTAQLLKEQWIRPQAAFVFISSLSHFTAYPGAALYAATKDGIASYARNLAIALAPEGHKVLTVFPGPTRTAHARRYSPDNRREQKRMPPQELARQIVQALEMKRKVLIPGIANHGAAWLGRLLPGVAEPLMRRTIYDKLPRA